MRVLVIADPHISVPPVHYGGTERIVALVCEGLQKQGRTVDLMAGPGSGTFGGRLFTHRPPGRTYISRAYRKIRFQFGSLVARRGADVILSFGRIDYLWALLRTSTPLIIKFSNPVDQSEIDWPLARRRKRLRFVGISRAQVEGLHPPELIDIVYNATDTESFRFNPVPKHPPYFAFLGRITANKGVHLAVEAARSAGVRLVIAGNVSNEPGGQEYFEKVVKPALGQGCEWIGPVNDEQKGRLLGGAMALLFPIQWNEPFGIVMAEALASGCPIVGWRDGSVPEVIRHGETGFIVESVSGMVDAIRRIDTIDRAVCRKDAEERFSQEALVNGYLRVFEKVLAD
jgi:glycosyltransferase involved in cell wall biosynthesis